MKRERAVLLLAACAGLWAGAAAAASRETMTTLAVTQGSGAKEGASTIEITRDGGRVHMVEERTTEKGEYNKYDVTFDEATLAPLAWTRIVGRGDAARRTELKIVDGLFEAKTYAGSDVVKTATAAVPAGPYCVAPLLKFFLARAVASNALPRGFANVGMPDDGSIRITEGRLRDLGSETFETAAGKFTCRHIEVSAKSMMLAALVPPMELFISETKPHPMVRMYMTPTKASATIKTDLQTYRYEPDAAEKPVDAAKP